jgi:hypothetical protein
VARLILCFWVIQLCTSFLATHIEDSRSGSLSCASSESSTDEDFNQLKTDFFPMPKIAKPPVASPYDYGWQKGNNGPTPILFSGLMSSDFLQDLICSCPLIFTIPFHLPLQINHQMPLLRRHRRQGSVGL